jgi:hypothetical protein
MKEKRKRVAGDKSFHEKVNDVIYRPENAGGGGKNLGSLELFGHIDLLSPGGEEVRRTYSTVESSLEGPARWALSRAVIGSGCRPPYTAPRAPVTRNRRSCP